MRTERPRWLAELSQQERGRLDLALVHLARSCGRFLGEPNDIEAKKALEASVNVQFSSEYQKYFRRALSILVLPHPDGEGIVLQPTPKYPRATDFCPTPPEDVPKMPPPPVRTRMTVAQLLDLLQAVEDKSQEVWMDDNDCSSTPVHSAENYCFARYFVQDAGTYTEAFIPEKEALDEGLPILRKAILLV